MPIAHSACSRSPAREGNRTWEAGWFPGQLPLERRGVTTPDGEDASPNASEPDSASLHLWWWPTCRMCRSLLPSRKEWAHAVDGPPGVIGESAHRKTDRGPWEARRGARRGRTPRAEQRRFVINNEPTGRGRESEWPIRAKKRGNSRGAKGPHFGRVSNAEGRTA